MLVRLLIALVLSLGTTAGMGYMLLQSHEKRGELSQALDQQRKETARVAATLEAERQAWEQSARVYRDGIRDATARAKRLRELLDAENNHPVPDSVISRLPQ